MVWRSPGSVSAQLASETTFHPSDANGAPQLGPPIGWPITDPVAVIPNPPTFAEKAPEFAVIVEKVTSPPNRSSTPPWPEAGLAPAGDPAPPAPALPA